MKNLLLTITETGTNKLGEKSTMFNEIEKEFATLEEAKTYIIDRYGKMPKGRNKIYVDIEGETKEVGFIHSFWNKDYSHNSKSWYQTDWITLYSQELTPIKLS